MVPYSAGPEESDEEGPGGSRIERVLVDMYNCDSDDEFIIAPELLEALRKPPLC